MSETIAAADASDIRSANDRQVGGSHYRTEGVQHWDLVHDADVPYLLAVASKYVSRHHLKNGREDLEKAVHYQEKWLEKVGPRTTKREWRVAPLDFMDWAAAADLRAAELRLLNCMLVWRDVDRSLELTRELTELRYPPGPTSTISLRDITEYVQEQPDWAHVIVGPGTPEDGGHHARQPQDGDSGDETEVEVIRRYDVGDILAGTLPESLSHHEWQHHCSEKVQEQYGWDVSAARFLYLKRIRAT